MTVVYYAVEGDTDAPVAEKLIRLASRLRAGDPVGDDEHLPLLYSRR